MNYYNNQCCNENNGCWTDCDPCNCERNENSCMQNCEEERNSCCEQQPVERICNCCWCCCYCNCR